jgi:hypothetical protein
MSYKDKPIIKLYKWENNAFVMQAQIDDFQEVSFEHNVYEAGVFTITINYNIPNALKFERGMFIQFGDNPYDFGEIITIQDEIGEDGKGSQIRTITGYDARYILKRRVIKNMNSNGLWVMTDKGEIVLRNLIQDQCGSNAEEKRRLPITNVSPATADAKGKEYSVSENFSNLYEVCKTIATQSEIGWRIAFDGSGLTLEVFEGSDLSQSVRFDTNYESLANGEFTDSSDAYSNAIYIGGKGQNDDRDIYEGEDGSPSGLTRYESWDNQSSMTTEDEYEAEALSMLTQYGQTLTMSGNGLAKCPYIFRKQYDIGDSVTVAFSGKSAVAQILSITEHWSFGAYDISFAFGKPQNNLADQLQLMLRKIQEASNKTNSTDSVRWYTIPTDTQMPKADVTYNTIGFVGTCANNGSTFQLYFNSEQVGAKTYHVYFKQLGGGPLTLTTGVSGKANLTLNSGTYVAIIYVDQEGNVTSQGATPTDTISTGNTQPATSEAVAQAISGATPTYPISVANGGTGQTTQANVNKQIIGNMTEGTSDVTDGTQFVSSYASDNGFSDSNAPNVPYKRSFLRVWNYIKSKIQNAGSLIIGLANKVGVNLTLKGMTYGTNTYTDSNPKIKFLNNDETQNISLTFTDYDTVQSPASLTLNGNQGGECFIAPNMRAIQKFKGVVEAGSYRSESTSSAKLKIKINSTAQWMLCFTVVLYQSYRETKIMVSGYQYGNNYWYSPQAVVLGDSSVDGKINVYFGYDSVNNLWVGFDQGNYTGIAIVDVVNGYKAVTDYSTLFTISSVSSLGGTTQTTIVATFPKRLPVDNAIVKGSGGLQFEQMSGATGNPANDWYSHLIMNHANSSGYYVDFAFCFHSDDFRIRRQVGGSLTNWVTMLHTGNILNTLYPIGAIYITLSSADFSNFLGGTWVKINDGSFIRASGGNAGTVGQVQAEGLPNITGQVTNANGTYGVTGFEASSSSFTGAFSGASFSGKAHTGASTASDVAKVMNFSATNGNSTVPDGASSGNIYGNSSHVTPRNIAVYMWKRTS